MVDYPRRKGMIFASGRSYLGYCDEVAKSNLDEDHCVVIRTNDYSLVELMFSRDPSTIPSIQYSEIGAGFGGYTPMVVDIQGDKLPGRPIVIDPLDYRHARELFNNLIETKGMIPKIAREVLVEKLAELVRRIDIYLNLDIVNLIQEPIQDAVINHPEILKITDVVFEVHGANSWGHKVTSCGGPIIKSIEMLLKEEVLVK